MPAPVNSNESHCTFTLASDVTAGGLPSEEEISKDLESTDPKVKRHALKAAIMAMLPAHTEAMELEPLDSVMSDTRRMV